MYSFLYQLYFFLKRLKKKNNALINSVCDKIIGYIEAYYNLYFLKHNSKYNKRKNMLYKKRRNKKIIASLTSYPKRISTVWITIVTIMNQTMKPDEIILWLAREQFEGLESLPDNLINLQNQGLTIRFCDDLKSHKKYYYSLIENPNDIVILFDDDMFYPKDTIKQLYKMHIDNPNDVCVITSQMITPTVFTKPSLWRNPLINEDVTHSNKIQIFSGSGTLLTYESLDNLAFDKELIKKLCFYADDLWLTFMIYKKGNRISSLNKWRAFPVTIYDTHIEALFYVNVENGMNDKQWKKIIDYFPDDFEKWEREYNEENIK